MRTDYRKLWKLLIDHNMPKSELRQKAGISSVTLAKLGKDESVITGIFLRICSVLSCKICDILDAVNDILRNNFDCNDKIAGNQDK
jgi:transcriptional regulator